VSGGRRRRPDGGAREVAGDAAEDVEGVDSGEPEPPQPVSSPPAASEPAVTSVRRRVSFVRRYSCCSAMLIRRASCGGMPKSGTGGPGGVPLEGRVMRTKFPANPNARPAYG
jgi:hypothetical protein